MNHTPLPWRVRECESRTVDFYIAGPGDDGQCDIAALLRADPGEEQADARYIVRAANAFPKLVEALAWISDEIGDPANPKRPSVDAIQAVREALAMAKGAEGETRPLGFLPKKHTE